MLGVSASLSNKSHVKRPLNTVTTFVPGSSDVIEVNNVGDFRVSGVDFSACFWIKITADASSTSNLDGYIGMQAGAFRAHGFYFWYNDSSGASEQFKFITNSGAASSNIATANITNDVWYHVAGTYHYASTTGKIYLNGELVSTSTSMTAPTNYSSTVYVGNSDVSSKHVACKTSEVAYWKGSALSADEVSEIYNDRPDLVYYDPAPTAYWLLNEKSATGSNGVIEEMNDRHGTSGGLTNSDFDTTDLPTGV